MNHEIAFFFIVKISISISAVMLSCVCIVNLSKLVLKYLWTSLVVITVVLILWSPSVGKRDPLILFDVMRISCDENDPLGFTSSGVGGGGVWSFSILVIFAHIISNYYRKWAFSSKILLDINCCMYKKFLMKKVLFFFFLEWMMMKINGENVQLLWLPPTTNKGFFKINLCPMSQIFMG